MEDRRFGIGSSTIWGGGEKHCEKIGEGIDGDEGRKSDKGERKASKGR